jgi:hypothetical protein
MAHRKSRKTTRKPARSTGSGGRTRRTHEARRTPPAPTPPEPEVSAAIALPPRELYRHEKRRRADQPRGDARDPLEEARREFKAMLEAGVGTPRGGRPRKVKPPAADEEA